MNEQTNDLKKGEPLATFGEKYAVASTAFGKGWATPISPESLGVGFAVNEEREA